MNELQIFQNEEFGQIRTIEIDGEVWFVGKDVALALGYAKPLNAIASHIDEDDSLKRGLTDALGREQETIFINESGVYALVFGSKLESAKRFKRWVTSEVLPAIRKTGSYFTPKNNAEMLLMYAQQLVEQEKRLSSIEDEVKVIKAKQTTVPNEYFTIAGYASLRGKRIDLNKANAIGRYAAKKSREYGYEIGKMNDPRFGTVNTYHLDILKDAFRGF